MIKYLIFGLCLLLVKTTKAETYLNGSYESSLDLRRESEYRWKMDEPWHRIELRFTSSPLNRTEFFIKTYANINSVNYDSNAQYRYELFQLAESHLYYSIGTKDKLEFYLFANQLRFYLGDPLFYLVNTDKDKWDEDGAIGTSRVAGFTIEGTGFIPGFGFKMFDARMYNHNVDAYGIRIYDNIIQDKLRIGATTTYKKWQGGLDNYNLVYASDLWLNLYQNYCTIEIANSKTPADFTLKQDTDAYKIEYRRGIEFAAIGNFDLILSARDIGEDFRAYLSKVYDNDRKYDQRGYYIETKYRPAYKAITFTYHRDYFERHNINYSETEDFFETYVEFIKDFNFKFWYKTTHQFNQDKIEVTKLDGTQELVYLQDDRWSHFFTQLEAQDGRAYLKLQFKIRNIQTVYLQYIYGIEYSINITDRLKNLNRVLVVDEIYRVRDTLWSQLQYSFGNNANLYLEYGNDSYVNDDIVNDMDFVESDNKMEHRVHLYIKVEF